MRLLLPRGIDHLEVGVLRELERLQPLHREIEQRLHVLRRRRRHEHVAVPEPDRSRHRQAQRRRLALHLIIRGDAHSPAGGRHRHGGLPRLLGNGVEHRVDGGGLVGGATQSGQRAKHLTVREGRRFQVQRLRLLVQLRVDALQIRV